MIAPTPHRLETAAALSSTTPRFAHLIYTSLDDGAGLVGGWQIKGETGNLTRAERDILTARIVTRFDVGEPLPTYPTPDQIAARPARLVYARLSAHSGAYWHTVDAGNDATGRPGNVLAHVLLDRAIDSDPHLRPVQFWESPDWLRPYGPADVAAASLTYASAPVLNSQITAGAAIAFLSDTTADRQTLFRVLLDALSGAMSGGPGVVLLTSDLDSGPQWISAASHFMSPGTARRFSWSTHDDPALARADIEAGLHLVIVARDRITELTGARAIVIDEYEEPNLGQLGATHHLKSGGVAVTGWSVLAEGVLADEAMAARLLAEQDRVATAIGDRALSPAWALAVAVRSDDDLAEFHADADQVVADDAPTGDFGELGDIVSRAMEATAPTTASEALARLLVARHRDAGVDAAALRLLHLGLSDDEWRNGPALADVPIEPVADLATLTADIAYLATHNRPGHPAEQLRTILRLAELIVRLGSPGGATELALQQLSMSLTAEHFECLSSAPDRFISDSAIGAVTRDVVLRAALPRQTPQTRSALTLATWRWLFDESDGLPTVPAKPHDYDSGLLPRYIAAALNAAHTEKNLPDEAEHVAAEAIYLALGSSDVTDEECFDLVAQLGLDAKLRPEELTDIFLRWPDRTPPSAALSALLFDPVHEALLSEIANRTPKSDHGWDAVAVATAQIRTLGVMPRDWSPELLDIAVSRSAPTVFGRLSAKHLDRAVDDVVRPLVVLFTIGQLRGESWCDASSPSAAALRRRLTPHATDVTSMLTDLVAAGTIAAEQLTALSVLRRIDERLAFPTLLDDDPGPYWMETILAALAEDGIYRTPTDAAALRDATWPQVRRMTAADAEIFFAGYQQAARNWPPRTARTTDTEGSRWGFRRLN